MTSGLGYPKVIQYQCLDWLPSRDALVMHNHSYMLLITIELNCNLVELLLRLINYIMNSVDSNGGINAAIKTNCYGPVIHLQTYTKWISRFNSELRFKRTLCIVSKTRCFFIFHAAFHLLLSLFLSSVTYSKD